YRAASATPSRRKKPARTVPTGRASAPASMRAITTVINRVHSHKPLAEIAAPTANNTALCHPNFHQASATPATASIASRRSARCIARRTSSSVKPASSTSLASLHNLRRRSKDLHKSRDRADDDSQHLDPVRMEMLVQQHSDKPADYTTGGQRQRQLNHRLGLHEAAENPAAALLRLVRIIGHRQTLPPAQATPPLADILKPHTLRKVSLRIEPV